jgi:segregation and condensation protein A
VDTEYKVRLDIFEGPLDLLLYLIKRDELDVYDISIEKITREYLGFIDAFKILNIELASEFIVMAANLMYIKSRTLLPRTQQPPEDDAEEEDPRWDLIRQLVEYKKFKDAAGFLQVREIEQENLFLSTPDPLDLPPEEDAPAPPPDVGIFDLIRAFRTVLARFDEEHSIYQIAEEHFTVGDKIDYLLNEIPQGNRIPFLSLFEEASSRTEIIVTFLALLELIKLNHFRIFQENLLGEIQLQRNENL